MTRTRRPSPALVVAGPPTEVLNDFSARLWTERELLDGLLFKLVEQHLLLRESDLRWVEPADDEVRAALRQLRACEVTRSTQSLELAGQLGLRDLDVTLLTLAAAVPPPWDDILRDHHAALSSLAGQVDELVARTEHLLDPEPIHDGGAA